MKFSVIIPTLNAGRQIATLLDALAKQTIQPDEVLVVDSSSADGTADAARARGAKVQVIPREQFDHGGTRDQALRRISGELVIFMTQDALPVSDDTLAHLLSSFSDERVAATTGRQIAYPNARPFEKAFREYRYPAENLVWTQVDVAALGAAAFRLTDVFAAYRREAYVAVGGFDHPLRTNEDMLMAQKLLANGWKLCYRGDAAVYHSHCSTLRQEYCRNCLIGSVLARYADRFDGLSLKSEGMKMVQHVAGRLLREGHPLECCAFIMNCAARLLGHEAGVRLNRKEAAKANGRDLTGGV